MGLPLRGGRVGGVEGGLVVVCGRRAGLRMQPGGMHTLFISRAYLRCERLPLVGGHGPLASCNILATREACPGRPRHPAWTNENP
jgi:hypothetical protein